MLDIDPTLDKHLLPLLATLEEKEMNGRTLTSWLSMGVDRLRNHKASAALEMPQSSITHWGFAVVGLLVARTKLEGRATLPGVVAQLEASRSRVLAADEERDFTISSRSEVRGAAEGIASLGIETEQLSNRWSAGRVHPGDGLTLDQLIDATLRLICAASAVRDDFQAA